MKYWQCIYTADLRDTRTQYRTTSISMVRAWYMDDSKEDQRLPHMQDPSQFVDIEDLKVKTGIEYFKVDAENYKNDPTLNELKIQRNYTYEDVCNVSPDTLPHYEEKLKMFFEEHLHKDEEIRLIIDGSGYFDVRDEKDQWIRVELLKGDMIILPAGIYHRFTMDSNNYTKAVRYFVGEPIWTPYNRPCDDLPERQKYLNTFQKGTLVQ